MRERDWRRIVDAEQHLPVSRYEDLLASALNAFGIFYKRQVKIYLNNSTEKDGIPYYKVDFLIGKLIVEVDSPSHKKNNLWDAKRDRKLRELGFRVLRIPNARVEKHVNGCVQAIIKARFE